jgi:alkylation response protein AidB-like acyl-CoA dehydrogenase
VPEEFGGAQLDYLTLALVVEEIAAGEAPAPSLNWLRSTRF